jgi:glucose/mannose-6-phosphate isomerase
MTTNLALVDRTALAALGPSTMLSLAGALGDHLDVGYSNGRNLPGMPSAEGLRAVVLCGMGGSGVAGDVVRSVFGPDLSVPVAVVKGYGLPAFCDRDTLVVASSFSGNTDETVAAYREAVSRGCRVVATSAGGKLAALAEADGVAHLALPSVPMPRAAFAYLVGGPVGMLEALALVPPMGAEIERASGLLRVLAPRFGPDVDRADNEAMQLAEWIGGRVPVIWGSEGLAEAAALRWKGQVNENAKGPAWASVLPELDHNEVEGWSEGAGTGHAAIVLRHPGELPGMARRIEATVEAVRPSGLDVREVHASGSSPLEWLFSLVTMADFATIYLGVLRGRDPMPIPILTGLKGRLAE